MAMTSSIFPLSEVPQDLVIDFLAQAASHERIVWKYFDAAFNRGRERGFVWYSKGVVKGFIGVIPCTLATPHGDRDMVWTCDWSIEEPKKNPGLGILLLKKVQASYELVAGLGGSEDTHATAPRIVTRTIPDAAAFLHLPLRLSGVLEKIEGRFPVLPRLSRSPLGAVLFPRRRRRNAAEAIVEDGVSPAVAPVFDRPATGACRPRYDHAYLDWQVGRCPGIRSLSCYVNGDGAPRVGAIAWCRTADPRSWRAAFRYAPGDESQLDAVVAAMASAVTREGGALLSTIVSRLDRGEMALLRRNGFVEGSQRWPLYLSGETDACEGGFAGLSYLDTDLATFF